MPANPYVGPRPIDTGERLFGRDRELTEVAYLLSAERVVLLHSPSGAGKSSLIMAGLIPRLRERFDVWRPTRVGHPVGGGAANRYALSAMLGFEQGVPAGMRRGEAALAGLRLAEYVERRARRPGAPENVLLVFDQFEEVLTAEPLAVAAKREFFAQLGELLLDPGVWALFSIREDYLAPLDPYAQLVPTHLRNRYRLDLLTREAAREAIVRPAVERVWTEPAVDRLLADLATVKVQQPDGAFVEAAGLYVEPMQLQVVCRGLWERMPAEDLAVDLEDVSAFGDVTQALAGYYALEVARSGGEEERALRAWVGEKLISLDGVRTPVLRTAGASQGLANGVIDRLVDAHLVRADHRGGAVWFELAHDRLVGPVRADNERWFQAHLQPMQVQAALWARQGQPAALLLSEAALAEAEAWAAGRTLTEPDAGFLRASRELRGREREVREAQARALRAAQALAEAQARAARRQRWSTGIVGCLGVVALVVAWLLYEQRQVAEQERTEARGAEARAKEQERAAKQAQATAEREAERARDQTFMAAVREATGDPTVQAALLREVARPEETHRWMRMAMEVRHEPLARIELMHDGQAAPVVAPDGRSVLTTAEGKLWWWQEERGRRVVLDAEHGAIGAHDFAADGRVAIASGAEVRVWSLAGDEPGAPAVLTGHAGLVWSVRFAADGRRLVTASADGTARVWAADGAELAVLRGHRNRVEVAAFSADGGRVATASLDDTVRVWSADGAGEPVVLRADGFRPISGVGFSPDGGGVMLERGDVTVWRVVDGAKLVTARDGVVAADRGVVAFAAGRQVSVWRAAAPTQVKVLGRHADSEVVEVAVAPDGARVVATFADGTARLWRVDGTERALELRGAGGAVAGASFAADGARVVGRLAGGAVQLWGLDAGAIAELVGHRVTVDLVRTATDGRALTVAGDGVRVWAADGRELALLRGPEVRAAEFLAGTAVATVGRSRAVRVWRGERREPALARAGFGTYELGAVSRDRQRLAVVNGRQLQVWDAGRVLGPVMRVEHPDAVNAVAVGPDGRVLLAGGRTAALWSVEAAGRPVVLRNVGGQIQAAALAADGARVVTGASDGSVRVWRSDGAGEPALLRGDDHLVGAVAFSPDGSRVVAGSSNGRVRVWEVAGRTEVAAWTDLAGAVGVVAYSPDGSRVVAASGTRAVVRLVDGTGEPVWFGEHTGEIRGVTFSTDARGTWVVTISEDATMRVWRSDGTGEPFVLAAPTLMTASFGPDGLLATIDGQGGVRVWPLCSAAECREFFRAATGLCLTADERAGRLGEPREAADRNAASCRAEVATRMAAGSYR